MDIQKILNYKETCFEVMGEARLDNGLFLASSEGEHYQAVWWRDQCFINLAYLKTRPDMFLESTYKMLDVLLKMESKYTKLSSFVRHKPESMFSYLHAKFNPYTEDEIEGIGDNWSHNQTDNPSLILIMLYEGYKQGLPVFRNSDDKFIAQLLVDYLVSLDYRPNSSSWEEEMEVRLSTTLLTLKALDCMKELGFVVDEESIKAGKEVAKALGHFEHRHKEWDLMHLYISFFQTQKYTDLDASGILFSVKRNLMNEQGCKRYHGDEYYAYKVDSKGNHYRVGDARWQFGKTFYISGLLRNDIAQGLLWNSTYFSAIEMLEEIIDKYPTARIPELVYADDGTPNDNTPLTWAVAMMVIAIEDLEEYGKRKQELKY